MSRGYIIHAQNTADVDYLHCAKVLAHSIKRVMPDASVTLMTDNDVESNVFDHVVKLPNHASEYAMNNDWQLYWASPYTETIKIEADIYIPRNIDYWWDILKDRDMCISTTVRDYKNNISNTQYYSRKTFNDLKLVNTYSSLTYFRKSNVAERFYTIVRNIFENWQEWREQFNILDDIPTTDVAYGIAALESPEQVILPTFTDMSMIHMKKMITGTYSKDWTRELLFEIVDGNIRINTFTQLYPFHYYIKDWSRTLDSELQYD